MKIKSTIPYILQKDRIIKAQNGIKYTPTNSNTELPEIEGYKPQFSNF